MSADAASRALDKPQPASPRLGLRLASSSEIATLESSASVSQAWQPIFRAIILKAIEQKMIKAKTVNLRNGIRMLIAS